MVALQPSVRRLAVQATRQTAREALRIRNRTPGIRVIPTCPAPTCECADVPPDLDIDRKLSLNGSVANYQQHLLVPTGQSDWKSKIENERDTAPWGQFVSNVKSLLGPKGKYHDPHHNVVVSTSSFEPSTSADQGLSQAILFPSFQVVDKVPAETEGDGLESFVRSFLLPQSSREEESAANRQRRGGRADDLAKDDSTSWRGLTRPITVPTILICSHHSRDSRCGILGPLLHAEFTQYLNKRQTLRNQSEGLESRTGNDSNAVETTYAAESTFETDVITATSGTRPGTHPINVGMISHIGGHKWAGNVIVYIPPDYHINPVHRETHGAKPKDVPEEPSSSSRDLHEADELSVEDFSTNISSLAGKGIWYGRVEPRHVEGIVEQTIGHGNIIKELFRGGINQDGSMISI